jgi:hypothetical protein
LSKIPSKKECATKRIFKRPGSSDCQEQFSNSVCGEHLAQTFSFVFVSKIELPFQKIVFTKDIVRVS